VIQHKNYDETIVKGELLLFHTLWHTTNDNMFIIKRTNDGEFITEKTNSSLKEIFNFDEEQIDGVSLKEVLDEHTYNSLSSRYNRCIELGQPISYEEKYSINETGERFWNTTILSIDDKENDIVRIFGISREITELKKINENLELEVKKRTQELESALDEIKKISVTDKLTGLYNRHHLDKELEDIKNMIKRYDSPYGFILLDIDDFKKVNDYYGHHTGDLVLKEFSSLLEKFTRETDIVGRWGGEEFLIIVPFTNEESILKVANNLKKRIEIYDFSKVGLVTSSFGVTLSRDSDSAESIITRADDALYKAKNRGKNAVVFDY